jgi:hypothetical protein
MWPEGAEANAEVKQLLLSDHLLKLLRVSAAKLIRYSTNPPQFLKRQRFLRVYFIVLLF